MFRSVLRVASAALLCSLSMMMINPAAAGERPDPHSFANSDAVRTTHVALRFDVDFKRRRLDGTAELSIERRQAQADQLVLDTRGLDVRTVEAASAGSAWTPTAFALGTEDAVLGQPLTVTLPKSATRVRIRYFTAPDATGLQWLEPAQTAGKKRPFLFSQSQAIHARSWIPLQDTPAVRATYSAEVKVPAGLRPVMSAEMAPKPDAAGYWQFRMPQPIPSYLIAIAVGDLAFQSLGSRTGVYAEPSMLKAAAWEFAETETTIALCEQLFGPYRWGRYDLLVLPPSFPYGGMENPRLTFLTPTVITGDRRLVALIAHELAHSWSGNLVTNATWEDFWLNEGFTEYLTYRLTEAQFGKARADMERVIGYADLKTALAQAASDEDRKLKRAFPSRDPDEVFSSVPYQRGALFLTWLESRVGREAFDAFLRRWFDGHAFESATSEQFVAELQRDLLAKHPDAVTDADLHAWISTPTIPHNAVKPQSGALIHVEARRAAWLAGGIPVTAMGAADWSIQEWEHFFTEFPTAASGQQLAELDRAFKLTGNPNAILAGAWYRLAIAAGQYSQVEAALKTYLRDVGRMKLIGPIYRALAATDAGRAQAKAIYAKVRAGYHPIAQQAVERILEGR